MDFLDLFSNGKSDGPGPRRMDRAVWLRSIMDRGGADKRAGRCLGGTQRAGTRAHWCSPAAVEEDELDDAVPEGCSPEHERWRRGGATEAKNGSGLRSSQGRRRREGARGRGENEVVRAGVARCLL
jgi:hypothetical protein